MSGQAALAGALVGLILGAVFCAGVLVGWMNAKDLYYRRGDSDGWLRCFDALRRTDEKGAS